MEGLMQSIIALWGVDLAIPDYSLFSHRAADLWVIGWILWASNIQSAFMAAPLENREYHDELSHEN